MLSRLHVADHPAVVWTGVVEPWIRAHGTNWREQRIILAPNAAWIAALKSAVVEPGLPAIGIQWHTPGRWRTLALHALPGPAPRIALREDLHLLMELAAARLPDNPLARAYGQDPAPFQEVLDVIDAAGWGVDVLPDSSARELATLAAQLRNEAGWITAAAADRRLREAASNGKLPRLGQRLLAVGFGPEAWPLRALLEAACAAYENTELALDIVDDEKSPAAPWVGAWEEFLGGAAELLEAPATPAPFAQLRTQILSPGQPAAVAALETAPKLWLAADLQAEADLVVRQTLEFLTEAGAEVPVRVGLVVGPLDSPLAREVAARLVALRLPHYDSPGHLPGRTSPQTLFEAWLDWQENGRLAGLIAWVRSLEVQGMLQPATASKIENSLKDAMGATLVDDPPVLAAWFAGVAAEHAEARKFLADWPRLQESARWMDFLAGIASVAQKLGWPAPPEMLTDRAEPLGKVFADALPRSAVLHWVRAVTRIPGRTRDALGREPFAPIQLVEAASAAAQNWTHLVLGGLQHGEWPANDHDSPLLDESSIAALNHRVLRQGSQGEGHWTVASGFGLLLSQADRRKLDRAAFARLAAMPTAGLALTSRRNDPADGRPTRLAEYFWAAARAVLGRLPTEEDWADLAAAAGDAREQFQEIFDMHAGKISRGKNIPGVEETAEAFAARRDPATPFGEFSFCLKKPPARPLRLSCKAWENAVENPGAAWLEKALRLEPRWDPATEDCTRMSLGNWAHAWVRAGPGAVPGAGPPEAWPLLSGESWQKLATDRAGEWRGNVAAAFLRAGRPLPESWLDAWAEAARAAEQWISALAGMPGWTHALAEVALPGGLLGELPGGAKIPLVGRVDLVLWPHAVTFAVGALNGAGAWVVDFKSGDTDALKLRQLAKGGGLQVALYALALQALGTGAVSLTLLNPHAEGEAQLTDGDLRAPELAGLWQLLADYAVQGRWGDRPDPSDDYTRAGRLPAATLAVPDEILRLKWKRTHPYFP